MPDTAVAALILGVTYLAIASERVNRTAAALAGAVAMIAVKLDGFDQTAAFASIDFNVIFLLAGMMIQVSVLSRTGVFEWLATHAAAMADGSPVRILIALSLATAVLSAFLDNVTTIVLIAPVTLSGERPASQSYALPHLGGNRLQHRRQRHADRRPAQHRHRQCCPSGLRLVPG